MNRNRIVGRLVLCLVMGGVVLPGLIGCQTTSSGQRLPSAYYPDDDVQYYPSGPEDPLHNTKAALTEYRIQQQAEQNPSNESVR